MQAIVFKGPKDFEMQEIPIPVCPTEGILVKIIAVGLCGSDIRTFDVGHGKVTPPQVIGHEVAGVIEEIGKGVSGFSVGDKVAINPIIPCGHCEYCKMGYGNHCRTLEFLGTTIPGGYAQYVAIPKVALVNNCVIKITSDLPLEYVPLAETTASVICAQKNMNVTKGDTVVIFGAGPIGCLHAAIAKARGAKKVIMSEINETRLNIVRKFKSIDVFVNSSQKDINEVILSETGNLGADVAIVACPVGAVQVQAINVVRKRGRVCFFGGLPINNCHINLNSNKIHYDEIAIFGAFAYDPKEFIEAFHLISEGKVPADQFVTDILPLKDIAKGIDIIKNGLGVKVVLKPWD